MKFSIVTPSYNSAAYISDALQSVQRQRDEGVELEHIVVDGGSSDGTREILERNSKEIERLVIEKDQGPADAINKGFALARGDIFAWLNADDCYCDGALKRVEEKFAAHPSVAMCFGHCPIIDESGKEIRRPITRFKEFFYPLSGRFTILTLNYISQPAMFFRRTAWEQSGGLRLELKAAWDYALILALWDAGKIKRIDRPPLAKFRWHPASISGGGFQEQFREEYEIAAASAGVRHPAVILHWFVRRGITGIYRLMAARRNAARF